MARYQTALANIRINAEQTGTTYQDGGLNVCKFDSSQLRC